MTNSKSAINKELILKLARQAFTEERKEFCPDWEESELSEAILQDFQVVFEKFAELIIAECSEAIIKDSRLSDVKIAAKCCVRAIKE